MAQRTTRSSTRSAASTSAASERPTMTRESPGPVVDEKEILSSIIRSMERQQETLLTMLTNQQRASPQPHPSSFITKMVEVPKLESPETISMQSFLDWKARWSDYILLTQLRTEVSCSRGQLAFFRQTLDQDWTVLWNSGRLKIDQNDDIDTAVEKIEEYIRQRNNPLVDRRLFHSRDQQLGESVDQYFAALSRIEAACRFASNLLCGHCGRHCTHAAEVRATRLRDRLICGLRDKGMQRRVIEEQYDNNLTLTRVLQICSAYESSQETGEKLDTSKRPSSAAINLSQSEDQQLGVNPEFDSPDLAAISS